MKENVSGCFFLNTVYIGKITVDLKIRLEPDLSFQIRQNPSPAGLEKINSVQPYLETHWCCLFVVGFVF